MPAAAWPGKPAQPGVVCAGRGSRSWAEQVLAVAAAEQEGEPLQVAAQLADVIGLVPGGRAWRSLTGKEDASTS